MPGQDERSRINEQEAVYAAEREKQRAEQLQQAVKVQRTAEAERISEPVKSDKLLPFLNAAHERYTARIVSLNSKKQTQIAKMAKNHAKQDQLTAKAERLSVTNDMLRRLTAGTKLEAAANAVIGRNQERIDKIRNEKIPKLDDKIAEHGKKIRQLEKRIAAQQRKADKCTALSNVITSFVMLDPVKRRAQFSQSMDTLHRVTKESLAAKAEKYQGKVSEIQTRMEKENLSQAAYDRLVKQMNTNLDKAQEAKAKLQKLLNVEQPYAEQSAEHQDMMQAFTEKQLDAAAERGETRINPLTETLCISAAERAAELSERVVEQLHTKPEQPPSAEQMLAELLEKTGYKQVQDNAFAQDGLIVLRTPDGREIGFDGEELAIAHLSEVAEEKASFHKFNPEYFKSIPRADRLTDTRTTEAAVKIMTELDQQGIPFSAVLRNPESASITVNQKQHGAVYLNILRSVGEPLPAQQKQQDMTVRTPEASARITSALDHAGIPNSSVSRGNGTVVVTDAQDRSQVNAVIANTEREHQKQFINPETYKQIPKEERFTKRMPEAQARETVEQLAAKGVPHSAVLDGNRSAVTVEKKSRGFVLGKQQRNDIASRAAQAKHQPAKPDSPAKQQEIG